MTERLESVEKQLRLWKLLTLLCLILWLVVPIGWAKYEDRLLETRSFVMTDQKEHRRMVLSTAEDGAPSLVFYDKDGKIIALLAEKPNGQPELSLYDPSGKVLFKAPGVTDTP